MASQTSLIAGVGQLGGDIAAGLLRAGHRVVGINRSGKSAIAGISMVAADLMQPLSRSVLNQLPAPDNVIIALAPGSRDPQIYEKTYREGVRHLITGLGGSVGRLLYVSSTVVYAQNAGEWVNEDSAVSAHNLRAKVQLECEQLAADAAESSIILRLGGIYGPGREALLRRVRARTPVITRPAHFSNRISHLDAAEMAIYLLQRRTAEGVFLGVDNEPAPMHEVCQWLAERMGMGPLLQETKSGTAANSGKRVSNQRVLESGFQLAFPTFREGYSALLSGG
ncbi:MAG: NAD-dependent epimerase/dehydratase family protein [Lysobacterales bacterium]